MFDYSEATGVLLWRLRLPDKNRGNFNGRFAGKPAGTISGRDGNQYLHVGINRSYYQAHRIIWKMVTGEEPPEFIDHKDGDNLNNRWKNLRPSDNGTNLQNAKLRKDNVSGVKGVSWDAGHRKWLASIAVNKRLYKVGRFDTIEAAIKAINEARDRLHGEFARRK